MNPEFQHLEGPEWPVDAANGASSAEPPSPESAPAENSFPIAPPFHLSRQQRRAIARAIAAETVLDRLPSWPRRLRRAFSRLIIREDADRG